jgi:hypothetical protein
MMMMMMMMLLLRGDQRWMWGTAEDSDNVKDEGS